MHAELKKKKNKAGLRKEWQGGGVGTPLVTRLE
jgi:hypothetical protein